MENSDDVQRNCPKRVELYSKNKFEKLVHLVGFIIRIQNASRIPSCERRGNWRRMMLLVPVQYSFSVKRKVWRLMITLCSLFYDNYSTTHIFINFDVITSPNRDSMSVKKC